MAKDNFSNTRDAISIGFIIGILFTLIAVFLIHVTQETARNEAINLLIKEKCQEAGYTGSNEDRINSEGQLVCHAEKVIKADGGVLTIIEEND